MISTLSQHLSGCFTYIPYYLDEDGSVFVREADPHSTQRTPLVKRLRSVLQEKHLAVRLVYITNISSCSPWSVLPGQFSPRKENTVSFANFNSMFSIPYCLEKITRPFSSKH